MKTETKSEFYWNGVTKNRGSFLLGTGVKVGEWKHYFYTGALEKAGRYVNGRKEGEWIYYNIDGNLKCAKYFKNGKEIKELYKKITGGNIDEDENDNM